MLSGSHHFVTCWKLATALKFGATCIARRL